MTRILFCNQTGLLHITVRQSCICFMQLLGTAWNCPVLEFWSKISIHTSPFCSLANYSADVI